MTSEVREQSGRKPRFHAFIAAVQGIAYRYTGITLGKIIQIEFKHISFNHISLMFCKMTPQSYDP